jgi:hypothetical protein
MPGAVVKVDVIGGLADIRIQPEDVEVKPGEAATFSVSATGRSLTYQWQADGVNIPGATQSIYSFAPVLSNNGIRFRCVITNASGSVQSDEARLTVIPDVRAYPNPWRVDRHAGASMTFDNMALNSTIKIFTLAAHWVRSISAPAGTAAWDLTNDDGQRVASGYYFYVVTTNDDRQTVRGKIGIIK